MFKKIIFSLLIVSLFSGCLKDDDVNTTCNFDACAVKASAAEIQTVKDYLAANNITATEHCSGVFYTILNPGMGVTPNPCKRVNVRYKGTFSNGTVFDERTSAITFYLNEVIRGWTSTIPLIKEGGSINLYIPPSLGYGSNDVKDNNGTVVIPGNSLLIFNVQLDAAEE